MNATYLRTEVLRAVRSPRYSVFVAGMPVGLFLLFASLYGDGSQDGISARAWLMVSMSVFGAMGAAVSIGGRIAGERQVGWTRQLRLTPLPGWAYVAAKAGTALLVAIPALVLVYAVGAAVEGVRLPAADWLLAGGWSVLALAPFVALGIWLGHRLTVDVIGPLSGALFTALGVLGGIWVPVDQLPSGLQTVARDLPSYWLAQAGRMPLAGSWIGWHGLGVLALWTAVFALLAARAYRRDTARA
ncbi:MAG TPA: ABC transporter permease [Mycobacteriales bacterium]|nr:ABC transporter permease [Mycobacteriales bacterium]